MPALWNAMSTRPYWATTVSYSRWTSSSLATSAATNSPPPAAAAALPAASSMSTATTRAPSAASRRALASPIPLPAPVMTATRSCKRCTIKTTPFLVRSPPGAYGAALCGSLSSLRRDEDVLGLGERVGGVRPEFADEAGLLEAAERRPVPHRRMRVHRQVAAVHRPGPPDRAADLAGPDRAGQAVGRVVGDRHRLGLVGERRHGHHRAEHLLGVGRVIGTHRREHGRRG